MKDTIKKYIGALVGEKPIVYISMFIITGYMITTMVNNYIEKKQKEAEQIKITIEKNDKIKQKFIDSEVLNLKTIQDKEKEIKLEITELNKILELKKNNLLETQNKINIKQTCINGVKATIGTLGRYDCTKQTGFIEKAQAEEIKKVPELKTGWLKNSKGLSKSREELGGTTFDEISLAHGIPLEYWYNSEKKWKVKKEVGLCIARADSGLGKYLKTKNNIGNVGNNDRGDRVEIATLEKGVDIIFQTLNNKYLKHKQAIGSLSPGGGGNKPYYATSPDNWDKNVRNCLSVIHGQEISKNFKIRL